jgi:hypothetical protein
MIIKAVLLLVLIINNSCSFQSVDFFGFVRANKDSTNENRRSKTNDSDDSASKDEISAIRKYRTNEELREEFDEIAQNCVLENGDDEYREDDGTRRAAEVFEFGKSVEGFVLFGMKIVRKENERNERNSNDSTSDGLGQPSFGFIGNMHGDEPVGREIVLELAKWACAEDASMGMFGNSIEEARKVKKRASLFFIPTVNPDGFKNKRRENRNGVDLNRDFPFIRFAKPEPKSTPKHQQNGAFSTTKLTRVNDLYDDTLRELQPETLAIVEFSKSVNLTGALNYHEGALVANYPWDGNKDGATKYSRAPDDRIFKNIALKYSESHGAMKKSKEFSKGITNGAQWYPLWGGMQDWHYVKTSTLDITIEVNDQKWPKEDKNLQEIIRSHCRASIASAHELMFTSARGFVFDKSTNAPLAKCEVRVENLAVDRRRRQNNNNNSDNDDFDDDEKKPPLPVFTNAKGFFVKPLFVRDNNSDRETVKTTTTTTIPTFEIMVTCQEATQTYRKTIANIDVVNGIDLIIHISSSSSIWGSRSSTVDVKKMATMRASSSSSSYPRRSGEIVLLQANDSSKKSTKYILFSLVSLGTIIIVRRQRRRRAKLNTVRKLENGQAFMSSPYVERASALIS